MAADKHDSNRLAVTKKAKDAMSGQPRTRLTRRAALTDPDDNVVSTGQGLSHAARLVPTPPPS